MSVWVDQQAIKYLVVEGRILKSHKFCHVPRPIEAEISRHHGSWNVEPITFATLNAFFLSFPIDTNLDPYAQPLSLPGQNHYFFCVG